MIDNISINTTLAELRGASAWRDIVPYFVYSNGKLGGNLTYEMSLADIQKNNPTWDAEDMAYGLNRILAVKAEGHPLVYQVYGEEEIAQHPEKADVKIFHFPAESDKFVILAAGGAYGAVCSLPESFPVAAELNHMGITVFCLNYRVGGVGLFPKPMEDLAAAYQYIAGKSEEFRIDPQQYAVGGFSAGGHLAACWGTENVGASRYDCPQPRFLILDYPLVNVWETIHMMPPAYRDMMLKGYLGENYSEELCDPYEVVRHMSPHYPFVYLIQAADDSIVPVSNSKALDEKLTELGISHVYESITTGGHGFGLGSKTEAAGWVERAVKFWRK